jgi:hypothetical protein
MRKIIVILTTVLLTLSAAAGWFERRNPSELKPSMTPETNRYALQVRDKASAQELVQLIGLKQNIMEETRILSRLLEEKKNQLQQCQKDLLTAFSMNPETNYQYDPKTKTIYELIPSASTTATNRPPAGSTTVPPAGFDRRLHLQLMSEHDIERFLRLTAVKKVVQDEMKTFATVIQEKKLELEGVARILGEKFSISEGKNYEQKTATIKLDEVGAKNPMKSVTPTSSSTIQLRAAPPQQVATPAVDELQKPVPLN